VAMACQGQRTVKFHANPADAAEQAGLRKMANELARGPHGSHGMGTRGPDANFEQVEKACVHSDLVDLAALSAETPRAD
jgi:hypothetical protein